jgi:hypothetical protein
MMYSADDFYGDEITSPMDVWGGPGGRDLYGGATFDRPWMRPMKRSIKFCQVRRVRRASIDLYDETAYYAEARHYSL